MSCPSKGVHLSDASEASRSVAKAAADGRSPQNPVFIGAHNAPFRLGYMASTVLDFRQMNGLKIARFAQLPTAIGFTWKWLAVLAAAGATAGLALALLKSLPVS